MRTGCCRTCRTCRRRLRGTWCGLGLGPVIASHANSRAVCAHTRNLSDDLFCAIRDSGGVVGLNLYTDFLGGDGMDAVVRHVEHLLDLGGDETLALGGDLDGCDTLGGGITGVQDYPTLYAALAARGYDSALLQALFSETGCACCRNHEKIQLRPASNDAGAFHPNMCCFSNAAEQPEDIMENVHMKKHIIAPVR
ncbi:MAG: membrane dipeptidase [Oscillospiraceae bacterium]